MDNFIERICGKVSVAQGLVDDIYRFNMVFYKMMTISVNFTTPSEFKAGNGVEKYNRPW